MACKSRFPWTSGVPGWTCTGELGDLVEVMRLHDGIPVVAPHGLSSYGPGIDMDAVKPFDGTVDHYHLRLGRIDRWRVGRHLGRTVYLDNKVVGMMDSPELGELVVAALNGSKDVAAQLKARGW